MSTPTGPHPDARLVLVLGGTRSGKSAVAERLAARAGDAVTYLATAPASEPGLRERIDAHRRRRPDAWRTVELGDGDPAAAVRDAGAATVLLDGLGVWLAGRLHVSGLLDDRGDGEDPALGMEGWAATSDARSAVEELAEVAAGRAATTIVVGEEAGLAPVAASRGTRRWVDLLGEAHQLLAARADRVLLVVAGRALELPPPAAGPAPPVPALALAPPPGLPAEEEPSAATGEGDVGADVASRPTAVPGPGGEVDTDSAGPPARATPGAGARLRGDAGPRPAPATAAARTGAPQRAGALGDDAVQDVPLEPPAPDPAAGVAGTDAADPDAPGPASPGAVARSAGAAPPGGGPAASVRVPSPRGPVPEPPVHGDRLVPDGCEDFAVNVVAGDPPAWVGAALERGLGALGAYPDDRAAASALAAGHGRRAAEVLPLGGGVEGFWRVALAVAPRRAAVVVPGFSEAEAALRAVGAEVVPVHREAREDWALVPERVPQDCDLVVVGRPENPTGTLDPREQVLALRRPGRVVVVDEAFADLVHRDPADADDLADGVDEPGLGELVVLRSVTKVLGVPGLRAGYLVGSAELVARCRVAGPPWTCPAPALAVLEDYPAHREELRRIAARVAGHRDDLVGRLRQVPGLRVWDGAANFVLAQAPGGTDVHPALHERRVAARPCGSFTGLDASHLRVSVRTPAAHQRFATALAAALAAAAA